MPPQQYPSGREASPVPALIAGDCREASGCWCPSSSPVWRGEQSEPCCYCNLPSSLSFACSPFCSLLLLSFLHLEGNCLQPPHRSEKSRVNPPGWPWGESLCFSLWLPFMVAFSEAGWAL